MANNNLLLDDFNPWATAQKIAERVRRRRLALNITQQSLATKSGVSLGSLKRFENKYEVSLKHLLQIALALDAMNAFNKVFLETDYQSLDELINIKKMKERERGRNV